MLKESGGKIKTGVYHSEIADGSKLRLHEKWRNGDVQVVCATIGKLRKRSLEPCTQENRSFWFGNR